MPLKFLKKCRQYNVTSKSLFVISVHHLLDTSTTVDCTVSSESKGQECLDNVCNRLQIHQPEFFGLRYVVKDKEDELKWIDLDRSLSRQLEKYANGTKIYLRVRHYVTTGVRHLTDEVTRYSYFLQLKSDIYEGKIACDIRTSILLALYCRQAEYDSYQGDKQQMANEYLKRSLVLPKNLQGLCNDDSLLDSLITDVLQQNPGIQLLTQLQAEEMYIQCCQQLEGYGEERFQAKDTLGNDLLLGLAINGIVVNAENGRQYFPWKDFHTVTIDKRTIKIEQNKNEVSIVGSFIFHEAETARYFWKLCVTQHKFFKRHIDEDTASVSGSASSANGVLPPLSTTDASTGSLAAYAYEFSDSREDLLMDQQQQQQQHQRAIYNAEYQTTTQSLQQQHLNPQKMSHSATALMSSNISLAASHQSAGGGGNGAVMHGHIGGNGAGTGALSQNWINKDFNNEYISSQSHLSNSILDTRLQSSSCLDLSNNNLHSSINLSHNNNNNPMLDERERLKAMLPTYRPAPDYETAVQLKYRASASELHNINNLQYQSAALAAQTDPRLLQSSHYYAGSQPDVHNAGVYGATDNMLLSQMAPHRYPDVAQPAAALHAHAHLNANAAAVAAANAGNSSNIYSNIDLAQRLQMMRSKPPPPYPVNRLSSSSTPDLAVATHRPLLGYRAYVSGSSPDLVSNRNMQNGQYPYGNGGVGGISGVGIGGGVGAVGVASMVHQYPYMSHMGHSQPYLPHGTFENLNMIEEQPSIMSQLRQSAMSQAAAQQASQNYEQHSPTVPSAAGYLSSATGVVVSSPTAASPGPAPAPLQRNAMNGSIEPIYENVPLPHYATTNAGGGPTPQRHAEHRSSSTSNSSDAMRNRASSIQSALGIQAPVPAARTHAAIHHNHVNTPPTAFEPDEISMNIQKFISHTHADRAASTEHFLEPAAPSAPQRAMRAASAAPAINVISPMASSAAVAAGQTPPPRQHHKVNLMKTNSVDVIQPSAAASTTTTVAKTNRSQHEDTSVLNHQFGAMNLSAPSSSSTSFFNSSTNSNTLDGSLLANTTLDTSEASSATNTTKEVKRKKRWNILRRSKTPDKQKSATLGREKTSKTQMAKIQQAQDDLNLPHRWSTGVPKLQPISGTFSKDKLSQILNDKLSDTQLFMEFERIPKRREYASYDCALMEENAMKNSDPNFLPYDDNRVRITPTMDNRHGYVNASHISATVGTKQRFYIVAQSPQQEITTRIFWQCVWEADVYLVVQLSDEVNYVPPNSNRRLEFGQFQVYQEFSQTTDRCVTSKLRLYHMQSRRYRSVWHLNYADWGEQNCPRDVNHFLDFLEELNSVRMASINEVPPGHNTNPPVLIHCLEGGGRSGVTLTADLLLYTLDHNEDLDIPRVIGQLRHQRDSIIPSLAQYKFIYSLLITYLKRTRLI